jgi:hypothetical protein
MDHVHPASKTIPILRINSLYHSTFAITWDVGWVMVLLGGIGFFYPHFLGLNLSYMHCFILAGSGLLAVFSGVTTRSRAYFINLALGLFFLINSSLGLIVGDLGHLRIGYGAREDLIVKFAPGFLELSIFDHLFHLVLSLFFFMVSYFWNKETLNFSSNIHRKNIKNGTNSFRG